jgi:hypothetical protein
MHWYGWTVTTLISATTRKIPPSLTWIPPARRHTDPNLRAAVLLALVGARH